jgi:hypothetical protein
VGQEFIIIIIINFNESTYNLDTDHCSTNLILGSSSNCWVCVIFFACVCVWVRQIQQLRVPCASGAFLGGSQGGSGIPPPGYTQHSAPGGSSGPMGFGATPKKNFWGGFCYF